jgi:hypothetical protein
LIQVEAVSTQFAPQWKTGADFLQATGAYVQRSGNVTSTRGLPEEFEVAGRTFWEIRLEIQVNDVVIRQIEAATIEKGYVVLFVFVSPDAATLDAIAATMNSLRFMLPPQ